MNEKIYVYKQREKLLYLRNQEIPKYVRCDIPPELEQEVLNLRNNILDSFIKNPEIFFKSIIELNQIFNHNPTYAMNIINIIWIPQLGECLLNSISSLQNVDETFTSQYISNNLLLIAKLLKDSDVQKFYLNSSLSNEALKMHSISENHINIMEQSIHVLVKTCQYYEFSDLPFNDIMAILKDAYNKSPTCERYVARYLKQIANHLTLSSIIVKKICDLFYFILRAPKSKRSIKHMMKALYIFIRYDPINYLNQIIDSKIINQFMTIYCKKWKKSIYKLCPCFLIPFLELIKVAVIYCDYHPIAKIFKIIKIDFFEKMYRNDSNDQIQSLICSIFIMRIEKSFCINDSDRKNELESITRLYEITIELFEDINYDLKSEVIRFTNQLLRYNTDKVYQILVGYNAETLFSHFSYYVFNSNDIEILEIYTECLIEILIYATSYEILDIDFFIENFDTELAEQYDNVIQSGEIDDEDTMNKINILLEKVDIARKSIDSM